MSADKIEVGSKWEHKITCRRYMITEVEGGLFDSIIKIKSETGHSFTISDEKLKKDFKFIK